MTTQSATLDALREESNGTIAALDIELENLLAAVRAFKVKAPRATKRVHTRAERVSDVIAAAKEQRTELDGDVQADALAEEAEETAEALLDALAELPSASPDDSIGGAIDHLVEYRGTLRSLAAGIASMTTARPV